MYVKYKTLLYSDFKITMKLFIFIKDLKYMSNTNQSYKELIEDEDDPKQLSDTLKSRCKYIVVPLEYHFYPLKSIYIIFFLIFERNERKCLPRSAKKL